MRQILQWIERMLDASWFDRLVTAAIVVNAVILTAQAYYPAWGWLQWVDNVFHWFFAVEVGSKLLVPLLLLKFAVVNGKLRDGWYQFDVFTVLVAFIPGLEALRTLRLFRLFGRFEMFREMMRHLGAALKLCYPVLIMMGMILFVASLIGYHGFHELYPDKFGTLGASLQTTYNIAFQDNFLGEMMRDSAIEVGSEPNLMVKTLYFLVTDFFLVFGALSLFGALFVVPYLQQYEGQRPEELRSS